MKNITAQITGLATLALAVLPIAALSTVARAETPQPHVAVRIADLNLASAAGQSEFAQRTHQAAREFCADRQALAAKGACQTAVRAEVEQKLARLQQGQMQLARN